MWRVWGIAALLSLVVAGSFAQEVGALVVRDAAVVERIDAQGATVALLVGTLWNEGDTPVTDVVLYADLFDEDGAVVGEGFGFIVNTCGEALLDAVLFPQAQARVALKLDLLDAEAQVSSFAFYPEANPSDAVREAITLHPAVTQVSSEEVVAVEWLGADALRYGVGCDEQLFTRHTWHSYTLSDGRDETLAAHPNAAFLTPSTISRAAINRTTQTLQDDPTHIERSFLTFAPNGTRMVWQTDIHTLFTGERDGTFRREVHRYLHQYSLKGFIWSPLNNFLAYYFGAFGDDVRYITASSDGTLISNVITANPLSRTVPSMTYDGRRLVIGATFDGVSGFYWQDARTPERELLFAFDTLQNNFPAPAYFRKNSSTRYLYFVLPDAEAGALLSCYHVEARTLHTLAPLPLRLRSDERAWSWLAPDGSTLALAAKGRSGGLWLVDLRAFDECQ